MSEYKFDWNDVTIIPATLSDISSRREINPFTNDDMLPLFVAPMDTVIDENNSDLFASNKLNICLHRGIKPTEFNDNYFYSYGLDEIIEKLNNKEKLPKKVLIDIANGHMRKLYNNAKRIKETTDIELMVGNIANPETYREYCKIGVDYIRVGIGGGQACTTSANVAIHYPMASLIYECGLIAKEFTNPTKIVADGGFRNFSDIIKAIGLGADGVMLGSMINKTMESCGQTYLKDENGAYYEVDLEKANAALKSGIDVYKYYRGMSTKEVQKSWNKSELKTGEGISKYNKVEFKLSSWVENFTDYLKSNMSYCGFKNLKDFKGNAKFVLITEHAYKRFNK